MISRNFVAAIYKASPPCSVNTALYRLSYLTLSLWSTTLPMYVWTCFSSSECVRWQRSMRDANWIGRPSLFACWTTFDLGLTFLMSHAGSFFSLFLFFVDCGLDTQDFHCVVNSDGLMHQTVVEFGHVSLPGDVIHLLLWFFCSPCDLPTLIASGNSEHENVGMASGFAQHPIFGITWHRRKHTLLEFCAGFGGHLEVSCIFGWNVEDATFFFCEFLAIWFFFSSQLAMSSCFCLFESLVHSLGKIVWSSVLVWVDGSHICILLGAYSSRFGSVLFQSIPLRARLLFSLCAVQ